MAFCEFAEKPWECCVSTPAKSELSGARHADVASFAVPEHHRNGLVSPMHAQIGDSGLEICSSGNGRGEGVG